MLQERLSAEQQINNNVNIVTAALLIKKQITFDFCESIRVTIKSNKQLKLLLFEVNKLQ